MERNIGIYRRFGFIEIGRRPTSEARPAGSLVDMEKTLGAAENRRSAKRCAIFPTPTRTAPTCWRRSASASIDDLFADIPAAKRLKEPLDLPKHKSELEVIAHHARPRREEPRGRRRAVLRRRRRLSPSRAGGVDHIIQRSEFLTSYTPYQPEIAQGTLQYLFEFQTQVANLTGMEVANASMYDGSTATAEAVLMAHRVTRRRKAVLSGGLHPHYREVVETVSRMAGDTVVALDPDPRGTEDILAAIDDETSCVVVQSPSFYGQLIDLAPIAEKAHAHGALLVAVFTEVVSLGLLEPPGAQGADIVVGEGQVDRQRAELRRALCRPLRDEAEISSARCRAGSPA